jgi:hypothetical protein
MLRVPRRGDTAKVEETEISTRTRSTSGRSVVAFAHVDPGYVEGRGFVIGRA